MSSSNASLDVLLLAGGISSERRVSLESGAAIASALNRIGHHVVTLDISPTDISALDQQPCDLVFPALHGLFGEDGQVQRLMEERGLAYVGSGPAACEIAMDKARTKQLLVEAGLSTPPWRVAWKNNPRPWGDLCAEIGYPQVVKPVNGGSSVDCHICNTPDDALAALSQSLERNPAMLIEKCICGPEITVGILDGYPLPLIQIKSQADFYDYPAKYHRDDTLYIFDIALPATTLQSAQAAAVQCHQHIGARHLSRVDIMIDAQTLEPFILEINTMPGFTSHSLVPKAAAEANISFDALCDRLCRMALRDRMQERKAVNA